MSNYRYQLEKYRGRGTRHTCPQCHRKQSFTRYIDTHNNIYISDNVGKCNRLDKCGYHYTPKQYFTDNPWKRDVVVEKLKMIGKFNISTSTTTTPRPIDTIPEWIFERSRSNGMPRSVQECVIARLGTSRGNLKERIKEFKELNEFKEKMTALSPNFPKFLNFLNGRALSAPGE